MTKQSELEVVPNNYNLERALKAREELSALTIYVDSEVESLVQFGAENGNYPAHEMISDLESVGFFAELAKVSEVTARNALSYAEKHLNLGYQARKAFDEKYKYYKKLHKLNKLEAKDLTDEKVEPTYEDYCDFYKKILGPLRKDIVSGRLLYWSATSKCYQPVLSAVELLQSYAHDSGLFKSHRVLAHAWRLQAETPGEFLCEIPEWDGRDRILEICTNIIGSNVPSDFIYEAICDWGAKMILRMEDPFIRNRILVISGKQNIGKDWLIDALTNGLHVPGTGYVASTTIDEDEILLKLHKSLIFKVEEFDRASRASVATLKHIITAFSISERLKYEREETERQCRASFIASANPVDILRDVTGNSRFLICRISEIKFGYPGERLDPDCTKNQQQIIAQYKHLAKTNFKMSAAAEAAFADYNERIAPDDNNQELVEAFDRVCHQFADMNPTLYRDAIKKKQIRATACDDIFNELKSLFGIGRAEIQRRLTACERRKRDKKGRYYEIHEAKIQEEEE